MHRSRVIKGIGYVFFGLFALLVSLYLTFPAQVVGERISHEVSKATRGAWAVSFADMSLYGLTGIAAEGVRVEQIRPSAGDPIDVTFDEVHARLQILPLFLLRTSVSASIALGEGALDVRVTPGDGGAFDFNVTAEKLNLASPPILPKLAGVPFSGELVGEAEGNWSGAPRDSNGTTELVLNKAKVGPGTIAGFTIPGIDLGDLRLVLSMKAGRLEISSFDQQGGQLSAKLSGSSSVRAAARASTLDVCVQLKADPEFLRQNPKLQTAMQLAEVRLRKDKDGYLHMPVSGTMSRPRLRGGLCRRRGK